MGVLRTRVASVGRPFQKGNLGGGPLLPHRSASLPLTQRDDSSGPDWDQRPIGGTAMGC
jgi:hypothetical protein